MYIILLIFCLLKFFIIKHWGINYPVSLSTHECQELYYDQRLLSLYTVLMVSLFCMQVKFSELTVDMFRMLQALEREPMNLASQMNKPGMQVIFSPHLQFW